MSTKKPWAPARALVVMAHPDDADYFVAGTVAAWAAQGCETAYVVATSGDKGNAAGVLTPEALSRLREAEQQAAAALVGAARVVFLGFADAMVMDGDELRRAIVAEIRRQRPQVVISLDPTCYFLNGRINHPDHRGVGEAVLAAVFPCANNALCYPEQVTAGLLPHDVEQLWLAATNAPDHWVDIAATFEQKVAALECNVSQLGPQSDVRAELTAAFAAPEGGFREGFRVVQLRG